MQRIIKGVVPQTKCGYLQQIMISATSKNYSEAKKLIYNPKLEIPQQKDHCSKVLDSAYRDQINNSSDPFLTIIK